jgi:two-component system OmpR family response regulator
MQTILVIEDDEDMRMLISVMLGRLNYLPLGASNGTDGLAMAIELRPDAILLDVMMPGMSGFDTSQALRDAGFTGKIVLMSAYVASENLSNTQLCGADEFVSKPLNMPRLKQILALTEMLQAI